MNNKTTIYVVRHGQSGFNRDFQEYDDKTINFDGKQGSDLTELGISQAKALASRLKDVEISAIFSSDLARAKQTAEILAMERKLAVETTEAIRERSVFDYLRALPNKTFTELSEEMREDVKKLDEKGKMQYKHGPNMESAEEGATRLLNFIREVVVVYSEKTVLIVCHGNIMRSLLNHLGFAKYDELTHSTIENTAYFVLESDGVDFEVKEVSGIRRIEGAMRDF